MLGGSGPEASGELKEQQESKCPSDLCLPLTERKAEEAATAGSRRGLQGHRQFSRAAGQRRQKAWTLAGPR